MKSIVFLFILLFLPGGIDKIAKSNEYKKEAQKAFNNKDYQKAISKYTYLLDTLGLNDENIRLNLAHAYYKLNDTTSSNFQYNKLLSAKDLEIASIASQQLGVTKANAGQIEEGISFMKTALKYNPNNEEARFNYELLKRLQQNPSAKNQPNNQNKDKNADKNGDKKQDQNQKGKGDNKKNSNDDQQQSQSDKGGKQDKKESNGNSKGDSNNDNKKDGEGVNKSGDKGQNNKRDADNKADSPKKSGEKGKGGQEKEKEKEQSGKQQGDKDGDKQGAAETETGQKSGKGKKGAERMQVNPERLQQMNLSADKANMLLDAMKNNEVQYLQQLKRANTPSPKTKKNKNKPDW